MARAMVRQPFATLQPFPYPITEVNRMIGDRQPDASKKYTFTSEANQRSEGESKETKDRGEL